MSQIKAMGTVGSIDVLLDRQPAGQLPLTSDVDRAAEVHAFSKAAIRMCRDRRPCQKPRLVSDDNCTPSPS